MQREPGTTTTATAYMHRINQGEASNRARRDQRDVSSIFAKSPPNRKTCERYIASGSSVADPWGFRVWRPLGDSRKPGAFQIGKGQRELNKAERRKRSISVLLAAARLEGSRGSRLKRFIS